MGALEYYTYQDYVHWEGKWELIDGQPLAMSPSPIIKHQSIANLIACELTNSVKDCERCLVMFEEDWKVNECTVLKPDVVLICDEPSEEYITKAPEIIVEVISKTSIKRDEKYKFEIYEKEKVKYYIIAYPDDCKAKVYKLQDNFFVKEGDFFTQTYKFENTTCNATINFDNIFKRFRKK